MTRGNSRAFAVRLDATSSFVNHRRTDGACCSGLAIPHYYIPHYDACPEIRFPNFDPNNPDEIRDKYVMATEAGSGVSL